MLPVELATQLPIHRTSSLADMLQRAEVSFCTGHGGIPTFNAVLCLDGAHSPGTASHPRGIERNQNGLRRRSDDSIYVLRIGRREV